MIVGAGQAGGQLLASLRQKNYGGRIVLIGDEPAMPYQRPPLSKKYLAGALPVDRLFVKPAAFYDTLNIDYRLGIRAVGIDRVSGTVETDDERRIRFDTLFVATGSRARRLRVPGSTLDGIHYLRNLADADRLRSEFADARRLAVVGAGYIGLEVAAVARSLDIDVTVIETADRVMCRVVSPAISAFYEKEHRSRGVRFELGAELERFVGNRRVASVELADGRLLDTDLVVIGIGVEPNTELAESAGLEIADGIVVDNRCRTADPRIFAVGDCSRHPSAVYGRLIRLESVQNALEQARTAVTNATGGDEIYDAVPWFWSDQYDLKLQIAGLSEGHDEVVLRGDPGRRSFACAYLKNGVLIAVDAVNAPREFMQSKALIRNRSRPDMGRLEDAAIALEDTPAGRR